MKAGNACVVADAEDHALIELAEQLKLPLFETSPAKPVPSTGFSFALLRRDQRLQLTATEDLEHPLLQIQLGSRDIARRVQGGRQQPLAKAVGLNRHRHLTVIDATAGLGRDAATLAGLGARVTMLERHPLLFALLQDALSAMGNEIAVDNRLTLQFGDACTALEHLPRPDVVYLDPMYASRGKTALPNRELQLLRQMVGEDTDTAALFAAALNVASRRVVVKRSPKAPCLEHPQGKRPELVFKGNRARFDVYLLTPA